MTPFGPFSFGGANQRQFVKLTTPDTVAPSAPTNASVSLNGSNQPVVTWTDPGEDEITLRVYRSTTSGSGFSALGTTAAGNESFTDTTAAGSTTYYYEITAEDAAGNESAASSEVNITTGAGGGGLTYPITVDASRDDSFTSTQQARLDDALLWLDEVIAGTDGISARAFAGNDDTNNYDIVGHTLFMLCFCLATSGRVEFFDEFDVLMDRMRDNLDTGFRGTGDNPDWNDGEHDVNNTTLLTWVDRGGSGAAKRRGTDLWHSNSRRAAINAALAAYVYGINPSQSVASRARTTLEQGSPQGASIASMTETTGADKAEFWLHWFQNHYEWMWRNRSNSLQEEMEKGGAVGVDFPWQNTKSTDVASQISHAITCMHLIGLASGNTLYSDEGDRLVPIQLSGDFTSMGESAPPDEWYNELTSDFGRPAYAWYRYRPGDPSSGQYLHPMPYLREVTRNWVMQWFLQVGNATDAAKMARVAHTFSDHAFDQTIASVGSWTNWESGSDVGGHQTDRAGIPDANTAPISQDFNRLHRNTIADNPFWVVMPWDNRGNSRIDDLVNGAYSNYGSGRYERGGLIVSRLLDAVVRGL